MKDVPYLCTVELSSPLSAAAATLALYVQLLSLI